MPAEPVSPPSTQAPQTLLRLTHIAYALQAASLLVGMTLVAAVIINYIRLDDVRGTWLESHFRWQIRTFWFLLLWGVIGALLLVFVVGSFILAAAGIWFLYRVAKGWIYLGERRPMYAPAAPRG